MSRTKGVQIQEGRLLVIAVPYSHIDFYLEVLTELHRSQESAYNLRDAARQSHFNRAKLCSKIIKYPNVEDYAVSIASYLSHEGLHQFVSQMALKEHDQKQIYVARQNLYDIRNVYAILTDILHKNIGKVRRSSTHDYRTLVTGYQFSSGRPRETTPTGYTELV